MSHRALSAMPPLYSLDLGLVDYQDARALQQRAAHLRISGELDGDLLLLCEHPAVVTLGRATKPGHLLTPADELTTLGVQVHDVERGGDITVHEPGQLVGYLVLDLKQHRKDLHWFLRQTEASIIEAVTPLGVAASTRAGLTGVWVDDRKLASIGVHARDWVTWHGFALNVVNDLSTFAHTVPCGIPDVVMTSVARECTARARESLPLLAHEVRRRVVEAVGAVFGLEPQGLPTGMRGELRVGS